MPRYTVIIIDHSDEDKAEIIKTDSHPFPAVTQQQIPFRKPTKVHPQQVIPNYDAVSSLLSEDIKPVAKKAKSKLLSRVSNRFPTEPEEQQVPKKKKPSGRRTPQELFEEKMDNEDFDKFNAQDLVCYYRFIAEKKGIRTIIQWQRDSSQAKKLQENFTNDEIMDMIKFLFNSDQDYLDKKRVTIGVINSAWGNTIFQDMQDWKEGKYVSKSKNKKKNREWTEEKPKDSTKVQIGWDE